MVTDITQRDTQVRDAYIKVFKDFVNRLVENKDHEQPLELAEALQKTVILIGGVAISRAINDDDLAVQLLKACQSGLLSD